MKTAEIIAGEDYHAWTPYEGPRGRAKVIATNVDSKDHPDAMKAGHGAGMTVLVKFYNIDGGRQRLLRPRDIIQPWPHHD